MSATEPSEETLLEQALTLGSAEARRAYLTAACGGDDELRARVESLLHAHEAAGAFLPDKPATGPLDSTANQSPSEKAGDRIGRYQLLEKIGEGGCGVVYMAEQEEPVRRKVALKIIKPGMDSRQVIARFEAERQALALMDHPNIARIFDGGVIGDAIEPPIVESPVPIPVQSKIATRKSQIAQGRPYFVMELVGGIRITDYCVQKNLSTPQRLHLFVAVCHAVQHAHQKGIIHRDLKPSNILVTENDGKPVPKVIDFGIAKATEQKLTEKTVFTQFAQFLGTPAYMSPEQAAMTSVDIDTRSDIYSLGVLLYELLTGTTPFDTQELLKAGFDEMRRVIRETEPDRPSTRLTMARATMAGEQRAQSQIANRKSQIDPDLDWIALKCLEKDRSRRYETANGLAADLQRHLNCEPVAARPPSAAYRFQKMVRRNKVYFAAAAAMSVALVFGIAMSTWQAVRATRAERDQTLLRKRAEHEAAKYEEAARFFAELFTSSDRKPNRRGDTAHLRVLLDDAARNLGKTRKHLGARSNLGQAYAYLGEYAKAERLFSEALALARQGTGNEDRETQELEDLAAALRTKGRIAVAESLYQESLMLNLAAALYAQGKLPDTERLYREILAHTRKDYTNSPATLERRLSDLADVLHRQGKYAEAEPLYRELFQSNAARKTATDEDVLGAAASLGRLLADWAWNERHGDASPRNSERAREGERLLRECQAIRAANTNTPLWRLADTESRLGGALLVVAVTDRKLTDRERQDKLKEAEKLMQAGHEAFQRIEFYRSADNKYKRDALERLARLYETWNKPEQAREWRQKLGAFDQEAIETQSASPMEVAP